MIVEGSHARGDGVETNAPQCARRIPSWRAAFPRRRPQEHLPRRLRRALPLDDTLVARVARPDPETWRRRSARRTAPEPRCAAPRLEARRDPRRRRAAPRGRAGSLDGDDRARIRQALDRSSRRGRPRREHAEGLRGRGDARLGRDRPARRRPGRRRAPRDPATVPARVVACITPFNFPLNLVAHKIGPAVAAGCPFVLKPASKTPSSALDLAEAFLEAGTPADAVSVLPLAGDAATALACDPRVRVVSFTGSPEVGWELKRRAFRQRVVLELGGTPGSSWTAAPTSTVPPRAASPAPSASRVRAAFRCSGFFAHRGIFAPFVERLLARVSALVVGDPMQSATDVGPLVTPGDAERVEAWIEEARSAGASVLAGGGGAARSSNRP